MLETSTQRGQGDCLHARSLREEEIATRKCGACAIFTVLQTEPSKQAKHHIFNSVSRLFNKRIINNTWMKQLEIKFTFVKHFFIIKSRRHLGLALCTYGLTIAVPASFGVNWRWETRIECPRSTRREGATSRYYLLIFMFIRRGSEWFEQCAFSTLASN